MISHVAEEFAARNPGSGKTHADGGAIRHHMGYYRLLRLYSPSPMCDPLCHATPRNDDEVVLVDPAAEELRLTGRGMTFCRDDPHHWGNHREWHAQARAISFGDLPSPRNWRAWPNSSCGWFPE